jgi:hypothetical protein
MEFHNIGPADESEAERSEGHRIFKANPVAGFVLRTVHAAVLHPAFGGEPVFGPLLFQMDQGALAWTIDVVLQGGKRQQLILSVH